MSEIIPYQDQIWPHEKVEQLPYYEDLKRIRAVLEGREDLRGCIFPQGWCVKTTKIIREILGLDELAGYYTPETTERGWKKGHSWSYDPERGIYVDLTQDQFIKSLPEITVLEEGTDILIPDLEETELQLGLTLYSKVLAPISEAYEAAEEAVSVVINH